MERFYGVQCDRHIPLKLKGKFYKTTRQLCFMDAECWAAKK